MSDVSGQAPWTYGTPLNRRFPQLSSTNGTQFSTKKHDRPGIPPLPFCVLFCRHVPLRGPRRDLPVSPFRSSPRPCALRGKLSLVPPRSATSPGLSSRSHSFRRRWHRTRDRSQEQANGPSGVHLRERILLCPSAGFFDGGALTAVRVFLFAFLSVKVPTLINTLSAAHLGMRSASRLETATLSPTPSVPFGVRFCLCHRRCRHMWGIVTQPRHAGQPITPTSSAMKSRETSRVARRDRRKEVYHGRYVCRLHFTRPDCTFRHCCRKCTSSAAASSRGGYLVLHQVCYGMLAQVHETKVNVPLL